MEQQKNLEVKGLEFEDKNGVKRLEEMVEFEQTQADAAFKILNAQLSAEIVGAMQGHYTPELIYSKPYKSTRGKTEWPECDLIKGGCPYKGTPHIHVTGVGIQGALTAMRSYGRMEASIISMPVVTDQGDKLYWASEAKAIDRHTGNLYSRWYFEPVMRKAGKGYEENPFGAGISQSKALRNVIIGLMPADLMNKWIADFKAGKKAFDPATAEHMGYGRQAKTPVQQKKKQPPPKPKATAAGTNNHAGLKNAAGALAPMLSLDAAVLIEFSATCYDSPTQAQLHFTRALTDEAKRSQIAEKLTAWQAEQQEPSAEEEKQESDKKAPETATSTEGD